MVYLLAGCCSSPFCHTFVTASRSDDQWTLCFANVCLFLLEAKAWTCSTVPFSKLDGMVMLRCNLMPAAISKAVVVFNVSVCVNK